MQSKIFAELKCMLKSFAKVTLQPPNLTNFLQGLYGNVILKENIMHTSIKA